MTEVKDVRIIDIKLDKNQPRKSFDEEKLKEMSETFKTQGTIQPIEIDEDKKIITGELRYRAAKMAGLKTIPCKILKLTPEARLERQLVENFNRQDMRLFDSIEAVKSFVKHLTNENKKQGREYNADKLISEAAKRLGISREWLGQNLKFDREAPPELKKAVKDEKLSISVATEIMKAPKEEIKELTETAIEMQSPAVVGPNSIRQRVAEKKALQELKDQQEQLKKSKEFEVRIRTTEEAFSRLKDEIDTTTRRVQGMVQVVKGLRRIKKFYFAKPKEKENFFRFLDGTIQQFEKYVQEIKDLRENIELEVLKE